MYFFYLIILLFEIPDIINGPCTYACISPLAPLGIQQMVQGKPDRHKRTNCLHFLAYTKITEPQAIKYIEEDDEAFYDTILRNLTPIIKGHENEDK